MYLYTGRYRPDELLTYVRPLFPHHHPALSPRGEKPPLGDCNNPGQPLQLSWADAWDCFAPRGESGCDRFCRLCPAKRAFKTPPVSGSKSPLCGASRRRARGFAPAPRPCRELAQSFLFLAGFSGADLRAFRSRRLISPKPAKQK